MKKCVCCIISVLLALCITCCALADEPTLDSAASAVYHTYMQGSGGDALMQGPSDFGFGYFIENIYKNHHGDAFFNEAALFFNSDDGDLNSRRNSAKFYVEQLIYLSHYANAEFDDLVDLDNTTFTEQPSKVTTFMNLGISSLKLMLGGIEDGPAEIAKLTNKELVSYLLGEAGEQSIGVIKDGIWDGFVSTVRSAALVKHMENISRSITLFHIIAEKSYEEPLALAASVLEEVYTSWQQELISMDYTTATQEELNDENYLAWQMKKYIDKRIDEETDSILAELFTAMSGMIKVILNIYGVGGLLSDFIDVLSYSGELLLGTTSKVLRFQEIRGLYWIYYALSSGFRTVHTTDNLLFNLRLSRILTRVAMRGEQSVYRYYMMDQGYFGDFMVLMENIFNVNDMPAWYQNQADRLKRLDESAETAITTIFSIALSLQENTGTTDIYKTENISGILTQGDFFADISDDTKLDESAPNIHAGEPAAGVKVAIVSGEGDTQKTLHQTVTDADGIYTFEYPVTEAYDTQLYLSISEPVKGEQSTYVSLRIPLIKYVNITFRSAVGYCNKSSVGYMGEGELTCRFPYSDAFFLRDESEYNHDLARLSLGMACAAYSDPAADYYWGMDDPYIKREQNIMSAYETLGFTDAEYYHYDTSLNDIEDKVAFSFASRQIENPFAKSQEDKHVRVIAVVLRGGGYGEEWTSNFNVGTGIKHEGFSKAANEVGETLKAYLAAHPSAMPTVLWVTGYSRSAATANLLSYELERMKYYGEIDYQNLYAYTFATPMGTTSDNDEIPVFNIVYAQDVVPRVAFSEWGFYHYGTTLTFGDTAALSQSDYDRISGWFSHITNGNNDYAPLDLKAHRAYISQLEDSLTTLFPTQQEYVRTLQPFVMGACEYMMVELVAGMDVKKTPEALSAYFSKKYPTFAEKKQQNKNYGLEKTLGVITFLIDFTQNSELESTLHNILALGSVHGGDLSALTGVLGKITDSDSLKALAREIVYLLFFSNNSKDALFYAHNPEVYMAWMFSFDSDILFSEPVLTWDAVLTPKRYTILCENIPMQDYDENGILSKTVDWNCDGIQDKLVLGHTWEHDDLDTYAYLRIVPETAGMDAVAQNDYKNTDYVLLTRVPNNKGVLQTLSIVWMDEFYLDNDLSVSYLFENMAIVTGQDGKHYIGTSAIARGANGVPEAKLYFYRKPDTYSPMDSFDGLMRDGVPDQKQYAVFLSDHTEREIMAFNARTSSLLLKEYNGYPLRRYACRLEATYLEEVDCYCFCMEQSTQEWTEATGDYLFLETYFTFNRDNIVLLGRSFNGVFTPADQALSTAVTIEQTVAAALPAQTAKAEATAKPTATAEATAAVRPTATAEIKADAKSVFETSTANDYVTAKNLQKSKTYPVYSGPGSGYLRPANGKASVSTNDWIRVYGVENGWALIEYEINSSTWRQGYIEAANLPGTYPALPGANIACVTTKKVSLTDDPNKSKKELVSLPKGTSVIFKWSYGAFAYVEVPSKKVRGYVNADALEIK